MNKSFIYKNNWFNFSFLIYLAAAKRRPGDDVDDVAVLDGNEVN